MAYQDTEHQLRRKALKHGFVLVAMRGAAEQLVGKYALVPVGSGLDLGDVAILLKRETKRRVH